MDRRHSDLGRNYFIETFRELTFNGSIKDVRFGSKADMKASDHYVCFTLKADIYRRLCHVCCWSQAEFLYFFGRFCVTLERGRFTIVFLHESNQSFDAHWRNTWED
jgi:hypothetical protein